MASDGAFNLEKLGEGRGLRKLGTGGLVREMGMSGHGLRAADRIKIDLFHRRG